MNIPHAIVSGSHVTVNNMNLHNVDDLDKIFNSILSMVAETVDSYMYEGYDIKTLNENLPFIAGMI